jgi:hypothetical protein
MPWLTMVDSSATTGCRARKRGGNLVGEIERNAQYLTEQPYGVVLATVTGLPASVSPSAART